MPRSKTAWKSLEKETAKALRGIRVLRGADFSKKDVDVKVPDFPNLQIDAKYRQAWSHHKFLVEIQEKYCADPGDVPILVTKHPRQRGSVVSLSLEHFGFLLDLIRELAQ
jgi:hypothetical protein